MTDHPITPPLELVQQWDREWREKQDASVTGFAANLLAHIAACAAKWSADTELEACCKCIYDQGWFADPEHRLAQLRAARRPKPPSLKEQALEALNEADQGLNESEWRPRSNTIRRALESLPD